MSAMPAVERKYASSSTPLLAIPTPIPIAAEDYRLRAGGAT
jgi:hypothetical protein